MQVARLVFFLTCTSTRSECTRTGILEARLARKGDRMSSHSTSLFARTAILKGKVKERGREVESTNVQTNNNKTRFLIVKYAVVNLWFPSNPFMEV